MDGNKNKCPTFARMPKLAADELKDAMKLHVLDNASDNKSRWMLGFFGWLVKLGYLKEVRLSMMMVEHNHEDIDAIFRCVSEYWKRKAKGAVVHPLVEYVHDYSNFFADAIYDSVEGIKEAREFVIKERGDGGRDLKVFRQLQSLHELYQTLDDHVWVATLEDNWG
eukprot:6156132-Pleurochrysis_carterae.AAC.2